ncbi:uncharacterized protein LOC135212197 [Macrobrachium nipponense]|uniref:uncharacterized protein LOC135212197 n=1 Tax=Macrobrachium nipponense TaxID=159736 RepID=UPI0030C8332F
MNPLNLLLIFLLMLLLFSPVVFAEVTRETPVEEGQSIARTSSGAKHATSECLEANQQVWKFNGTTIPKALDVTRGHILSSALVSSLKEAHGMEALSQEGKEKLKLTGGKTSPGIVPSSSNARRRVPLRQVNASLVDLLLHVVKREMEGCNLLIAYDQGYKDVYELRRLAVLPNIKQNLQKTLKSILWTSNQCQGYIFLTFTTPALLLFANNDVDLWNYHGRYIFVSSSTDNLEQLVASQKGKKTENIIGIVQSSITGEWEVYTNRLFWGKGIEKITTWKNGRFSVEAELYPDKVFNLKGAQLVVTTFKWEPEVMYYWDEKGNVLFFYGIDIEVVNTLKSAINFTVKYQEPPKGQMWGEQSENGSWTGMMGMVSRDETDMCFPLYVSVTRLGILDYTTPYKLQKSCFLIKTEPPLPNWQALAFPFNPWTWLSILIGFFVSGTLLYLFALGSGLLVVLGSKDKIRPRAINYVMNCTKIQQVGKKSEPCELSSAAGTYNLALHLSEPPVAFPKQSTTMIYTLFLSIYCFILSIAYSTNLTAFLTVKKDPPRMETIQDLHESGMGVSAASAFYKDMFMESPDASLHELAKRYEVLDNQDEIFQKIRDGRSTYPENEGYLEFIIHTKLTKRGVPQARILRECYALHSAAMALQNYSPLKKRFDQVIDGMISGGLIRRFLVKTLQTALKTKEYGNSGQPVEDENEEASDNLVPLSLDHMQGLFFITIAGWILSALAFVYEILI